MGVERFLRIGVVVGYGLKHRLNAGTQTFTQCGIQRIVGFEQTCRAIQRNLLVQVRCSTQIGIGVGKIVSPAVCQIVDYQGASCCVHAPVRKAGVWAKCQRRLLKGWRPTDRCAAHFSGDHTQRYVQRLVAGVRIKQATAGFKPTPLFVAERFLQTVAKQSRGRVQAASGKVR